MIQETNPELVPSDVATPTKIVRLSSALSRSHAICFAIFDQDLRFRAVNQVLAATHGVSVKSHIGTNMREIIGELAAQAAPAVQQVLRNDQSLYFETLGKLPNRSCTGSWVNHFFPVETPAGKVKQVGVLAVEVTELRRLDELYRSFTTQLFPRAAEVEVALLRDLHRCIREYKTALGLNLACVSNSTRDPERTIELFAHSMHLLEQRIEALSSAVARCFPLDQQH